MGYREMSRMDMVELVRRWQAGESERRPPSYIEVGSGERRGRGRPSSNDCVPQIGPVAFWQLIGGWTVSSGQDHASRGKPMVGCGALGVCGGMGRSGRWRVQGACRSWT